LGINDAFLEPEYPFEWAGIYFLRKGQNFLKLSEGPDPDMSLICYPIPDQSKIEIPELAETVFRLWAELPTKLDSTGEINPSNTHWNLDLPQETEFSVNVPKDGTYAFFTQHTPEEFDLVLKDVNGDKTSPIEDHYFAAGHTHDDTVTSVALECTGDLDSEKLNSWFSVLLQTEGPNIFRMKGILSVKDSERKMVFQGVHMLFDSQPGEPWGEESRHSRLVFIGRELNQDYLQETLKLCLA